MQPEAPHVVPKDPNGIPSDPKGHLNGAKGIPKSAQDKAKGAGRHPKEQDIYSKKSHGRPWAALDPHAAPWGIHWGPMGVMGAPMGYHWGPMCIMGPQFESPCVPMGCHGRPRGTLHQQPPSNRPSGRYNRSSSNGLHLFTLLHISPTIVHILQAKVHISRAKVHISPTMVHIWMIFSG